VNEIVCYDCDYNKAAHDDHYRELLIEAVAFNLNFTAGGGGVYYMSCHHSPQCRLPSEPWMDQFRCEVGRRVLEIYRLTRGAACLI
jgi:hypothetical protein